MIRCVIYTLLNSFNFSRVIGPVSSKIFTIDSKFDHFWKHFLDIIKDFFQIVMEFNNKISCIVEGLGEILAWIFTLNGNFLAKKVCPSSISHNLFSTMNRKVRSMYFLGSDPENLCIIMPFFFNHFDELIPGWELDGGVILENKILGKHLLLSFFWFHYNINIKFLLYLMDLISSYNHKIW